MKIIIRLKSGYEFPPITCESFKYATHEFSGKLVSYEIKGANEIRPLYFNLEDVECIYSDVRDEVTE